MKCYFCQSVKLKLIYKNKYHRKKADHGPISFYQCLNCHSGLTLPAPSAEDLEALYASFDGGMSKFTRDIRDRNPLSEWYDQCIKKCIAYSGNKYGEKDVFKWMDVGAGNGEIAKMMSDKFPCSSGIAVDFHKRPELLSECKNVSWLQLDLNDPDFHSDVVSSPFDVIMSITVLEHVINPYYHIKSLLKLLAPKGSIYLTTPDMSSTAAKLLNVFWPYLIWGEHINMPSQIGMRLLLEQLSEEFFNSSHKTLIVKPVILPYPITYYLDHFHLNFISELISKKALLKVNTGILEASISY